MSTATVSTSPLRNQSHGVPMLASVEMVRRKYERNSIVTKQSEKHAVRKEAGPAVVARRAPPGMRRGLGVELSDESFAQRLRAAD